MNRSDPVAEMRGIWFGWPITHRLEDWCVTLDWMAELGFNTLVFPVYYEWNALADLKSVPEMMAKNVVRATYWSASRGEDLTFDGPPPMSAPGAFPSLLGEAAKRGIKVFPLITSFGHNFLLVAAYPEIRAQGPADPCPIPCTSNPRTHELLFQIYEDVLNQYPNPPAFVHVAMDEQWQLCQCAACAQKGPVQVYIEHLSKIHGFFAARSIRMIMFDDMLRPLRGRPRHYFDADEQIAEILHGIPKDIVMNAWKYSTPVEAEEMAQWVAWFAEHGFEVCLCPGHNLARAHVLFDATPNALTMLEFGLKPPGSSAASKAAGVITYSPHVFPQEPYYHALAEKMKTGKDDGAKNFLRASLGDHAEEVDAALADITECALAVPTYGVQGGRLDETVKSLAGASGERRAAILSAATRMAKAADRALSLLEEIVRPSGVVSRLIASFYLARTVASRLRMAHALVEGNTKILAHWNTRDIASADREFANLRVALENGMAHLEAALRVLEPVLDWDRHVHRVLCLLSSERTFIQNQLQLLNLAQQNTDRFLYQNLSWAWPPGWCVPS